MHPDKEGNEQKSEVTAARRSSGKSVYKLLLNVGVLVLVLIVGIGIGDGRLHLRSQPKGETGLPATLDYSTVNDVYNSLKTNYNGKLTASQITDGLKHGLAEATNDPYTEYFTAKEAKDFNNELNNSFSGIGAELGQDSDKNLLVIAPISGFPADKAGVKAQDIIATINGTSTTGMSVDEAVTKIRGPKGSSVKLRHRPRQIPDVIVHYHPRHHSATQRHHQNARRQHRLYADQLVL